MNAAWRHDQSWFMIQYYCIESWMLPQGKIPRQHSLHWIMNHALWQHSWFNAKCIESWLGYQSSQQSTFAGVIQHIESWIMPYGMIHDTRKMHWIMNVECWLGIIIFAGKALHGVYNSTTMPPNALWTEELGIVGWGIVLKPAIQITVVTQAQKEPDG